MPHGKKLTREMRKLVIENGYDPLYYFYLKNTKEELVICKKDSPKEIHSIRKDL